jgi:TolB-like protein
MSDIFISYSSKDREKAKQLTEMLTSSGLSVWIDLEGIGAASRWSEEIVHAINNCHVLILLLSSSSVQSHNVIKEVSLASEKTKKILPVELEPVEVPVSMQYALAGIQRTTMSNIDSVLRALSKFGLETSKPPELKIVKEKDGKKSLMICPFEDLSPTADNQWFADGIVTELIGALSHVKLLRLTDPQTTKEFRNYRGPLANYAREMSIRYFVQGSIRKMGEQLKIMAHVLDIESGDYLWQDSLRGTMDDIFDIQETVAKKVVAGLAIILTPEEEKKVDKKPTENAEAYELYLKGRSYFSRQTKNDFERALKLFEEAVKLDPHFAHAYAEISNTSQGIYRQYNRNPALLDQAADAAEKVRELEGETAQYYWAMSNVTRTRGDAELALKYALKSQEIDPKYPLALSALVFAYHTLGNQAGMVKACQDRVNMQENDRIAHFNLLISLHELGDKERLRIAAERAIPVYERYIRLNPDDFNARVSLANIFSMAERPSESLQAADELTLLESLDGGALYNLACLYLMNNTPERGMELLYRAVAKGFRNIDDFRHDPVLAPVRGTPEFEELLKKLEA